MSRIIAVIGMCGAGKTEAVQCFIERSFKRVYFGDVVINEIKNRSLEINEINERKVREELRKEFGMGVMALKSIDAIRNYINDSDVVIESLYSWEEFKILKSEFGDRFKLLTIFTKKELRYTRLTKRNFRRLTPAESESRDISEIENLDKAGPIAFTDYLITNNGTIGELIIKVNQFIETH